MSKEKHVTFREDAEVIKQLTNAANAEGLTRGSFIRQTLRQKLKEQKTNDSQSA